MPPGSGGISSSIPFGSSLCLASMPLALTSGSLVFWYFLFEFCYLRQRGSYTIHVFITGHHQDKTGQKRTFSSAFFSETDGRRLGWWIMVVPLHTPLHIQFLASRIDPYTFACPAGCERWISMMEEGGGCLE